MSEWNIRPVEPSDRNFIMSSWLKSFKTSHFAGPIPYNLYWKTYQAVLDQLLARNGIRVAVAEVEGNILGYAVFEDGFAQPTVHWCYVKHFARKSGIMADLLAQNGIDRDTSFFYTFRVAESRDLTDKDGPYPNAVFRPSVVRSKKREAKAD